MRRASAGLILTEATSVSPHGVGYPDTPGIWSAEQIEGWRQITEGVHAAVMSAGGHAHAGAAAEPAAAGHKVHAE